MPRMALVISRRVPQASEMSRWSSPANGSAEVITRARGTIAVSSSSGRSARASTSA